MEFDVFVLIFIDFNAFSLCLYFVLILIDFHMIF